MPLQLAPFARRHWFHVLLPFALLASYSMSATADWGAEARLGEAALLFDWCLFVPALYALHLRGTVGGRTLGLRVLAMACAGLWFARWLTPDASEVVLAAVAPLRWVRIAVLVVAEAAILVAVVRVAFSKKPDAAAIERRGVPPLLARLMLLEARFWRWVWSRLRGR
ncbi:hypothetical protein [Sphingomonas lenta]|uniref:Uncharacterized protein n=1 Tax=Sphingomonas lenta TaxID=1141887 RepID=A0A2A2SD21_9SPHN|nr:hypothetical protein [Sphingomonas lenta]PAX07113.1 hypothetical protein CKY28_13790 [Sphingomonas lenta]